MKRLHNYIILSVLAIAFASCSEDEVIDNNGQNHVAGDILFGLSLPEASSRTVYGDEDKDKNVFPIYWVNGDKVQIFSPQGLEGRRNAEYQVAVTKTNQNYADNLTKTGAYGVQWGTGYKVGENSGYHDFYSLYPSGNYTLSTDGTKAENITINSMQNIVVNGGVVKSDMEDCLMYAKTTGVAKGKVVNLQYNPISTVLMVTVKVADNEQGTDADNFTIQSIKLEADANIAGTFSLNIADGSFGEFAKDKGNNIIQAEIVNTSTGGYHSISNGESFEIPLFLAPVAELNVKNWKISIVANNNIYTKTLNIEKALTPGQIHKITLPKLAPAATDWDITKWMTYIPRNVYLSEVSIPGSWNSLNPDFQSNTSISGQYENGVRAFHLDTRWKADYRGIGISTDEKRFSNFELSVANGGGTREVGTILGAGTAPRVMKSDAPTFVSCLSEITTKIRPDEYMVLFCSFAQDSYNNVDYIGNTWLQAISDACEDNEVIYDGSSINPNTLVGDVLGHVIVIVNCENEISKETLPENSKCLFCHIPNHLTGDYFPASDFKSDNLHSSSSSSTAAISMAVSQAQITSSTGNAISDGVRGYYPSFDERTRVVNAILDWSKNNYGTANYAHDKWVYLGLGGNTASSKSSTGDDGTASNVATTYSKLINDRIASMGNNGVPYYPIGIVYLNNTTSNPSVETVKNVLLLNNKYRLQYDATKPSDYKPNDGQGGEGGDAI